MIIRMVKKDRTIHDAFVFAYKADGWKTKVIILDEDKDKFVEVPLWKRKYNLKSNVSIIEGDLSEYYQVDAKTFSFWNIPNIFLLVKQQNYPENYISDALSIQKDLEVVTWHQVTTQTDVDSLLKVSFGFHDAYIERIVQNGNELDILFNTTWGLYLHLIFTEVDFTNVEEKDLFFGAVMNLSPEKIEINFDDGYKSIRAKAISWRVLIEDRYTIKHTDYRFEDDVIMFTDVDQIDHKIDIKQIFEGENARLAKDQTMGIINKPEVLVHGYYTFIQDKSVLELRYEKLIFESESEFIQRFFRLEEFLIENNYKLITHDGAEYYTDTESYRQQNYGTKHIDYTYDSQFIFKNRLKKLFIVFLIYAAILIGIVSVVEKEYRLITAIILGSFEALILFLLTWLFSHESKRVRSQIEVYDEVIMVTGGLPTFEIHKSDIRAITYKKEKAYIHLTNGKVKKIVLPPDIKEKFIEVITTHYNQSDEQS